MIFYNWKNIKKMGRKKAIAMFKKVHPNIDFEKLYDQRFPPEKKEKKED